jgi:hypothetical protein
MKFSNIGIAGMMFIYSAKTHKQIFVIMKKILSILTLILMTSIATLAQDKDSADVKKGNSEIRQNEQADPQRPTADEADADQNPNSGNKSENSGSNSSSNEASPIPRGEPAILDGTNAIPVDSSKESTKHLKDDDDRPKKKSKN